jgi:hypothetical protein
MPESEIEQAKEQAHLAAPRGIAIDCSRAMMVAAVVW